MEKAIVLEVKKSHVSYYLLFAYKLGWKMDSSGKGVRNK